MIAMWPPTTLLMGIKRLYKYSKNFFEVPVKLDKQF